LLITGGRHANSSGDYKCLVIGAGGGMTEKSDEPDEPLTIKFSKVGEWWTATVQTPNGMLVGSGPTREAAQEELDWLMLHRSEKSIPPG